MTINQRRYQKTLLSLVASLWFVGAEASVTLRHYQVPIGQEAWKTSSTRLRCGLSYEINNYGVASFEQLATKDPAFLMTNWQQEKGVLPAQVWTVAPIWKSNKRAELVVRTDLKDKPYALELSRLPTLKLLAGLAQGYRARLKYRSDFGYNVRVDVSPVNFSKAYNQYIRCVGNLLQFNLDDIKNTVLYFGNDRYELSEHSRDALNKISEYISLDKTIKKIIVSGYSDDVGRRGVNNAVSELRAKRVYSYLLDKGVPEEKLKVTWYGIDYPIASNETESGRSKNRRVEVDLLR